MLTLVPPAGALSREDQRELVITVERLRSLLRHFDWDRFNLGWCALFHLAVAAVMASAPEVMVRTEGIRPALELAPRLVWAIAFTSAAAGVLLLGRGRPLATQVTVWAVVLFLGGMWFTSFALAALDGRGSAVALVVWPVIYGPWAITAFRLVLGKR